MSNYYGSICLSDIPKRLIKKADNGKLYLNIDVVELKEPGQYGDTHFIAASCKKDDRVDGENRFIGHLKPSEPRQAVTPEQVAQMPAAPANKIDELPF